MSEQKFHDLSFLENLSTPMLESILRADIDNSDAPDSDIEATLYIMEVLAKRARENGHQPDVEGALDRFKHDYLPLVGQEPLYGISDASEMQASQNNAIKSNPKLRRFFYRVAATAAVLALLIVVTTVTAYACGFNIWGAFATWTADTFWFTSAENEISAVGSEPVNHLPNLVDTLREYEVEECLAPTWLPSGYQLDAIDVYDSPIECCFGVRYLNNNECIYYQIRHLIVPAGSSFEIEDGSAEQYSIGNIVYYITENDGQFRAIWLDGNNELSISGCSTSEDLHHIILSIYQR